MADIIRVAFRQLGGEADAPLLMPPWFLPGAEAVWQRIVETERALRSLVREVYAAHFGEKRPSGLKRLCRSVNARRLPERSERALPDLSH